MRSDEYSFSDSFTLIHKSGEVYHISVDGMKISSDHYPDQYDTEFTDICIVDNMDNFIVKDHPHYKDLMNEIYEMDFEQEHIQEDFYD